MLLEAIVEAVVDCDLACTLGPPQVRRELVMPLNPSPGPPDFHSASVSSIQLFFQL